MLSITAALLATAFLPSGISSAQIPIGDRRAVEFSLESVRGGVSVAHVRTIATGEAGLKSNKYSFAGDREYWFSNSVDDFLTSDAPSVRMTPIDEDAVDSHLDGLDYSFSSARLIGQAGWTQGESSPAGKVAYFSLDCSGSGIDCGSPGDQHLILQVESAEGRLTKFTWYRQNAPADGLAFHSTSLSARLRKITSAEFRDLTRGTWFYAAHGNSSAQIEAP
ncbi:hypothetical protein ABZV60_26460 [Streptomyces sp. NPDC004787]|uniref:hypothetical protein n=1 Tax=Streptomyces sp. NPDC004787 TaxID=3154291 RepID=UPI0033BC8FD1